MASKEEGMKGEPPVPRALTAQDERKLYKSPQRKLVRFFAQSRDQWKGKCRAAKAGLKTLRKKLQRGEERQQRWKSRVQALEEELARLRTEHRALEAAGEAGEKKGR
jgi:uncharacterized protein YlxW (UPF0749 family)